MKTRAELMADYDAEQDRIEGWRWVRSLSQEQLVSEARFHGIKEPEKLTRHQLAQRIMDATT